MADLPALASGLPTTEPGRAPGVYQTVQASPEDFGAQVGRAVQGFGVVAQQVGTDLFKLNEHFDDVAADEAANQYESRVQSMLYGGEDGSPGYMGLQGRAALDARPTLQDQIKGLREEILSGLKTDAQKQKFNRFADKFGTSVTAKIGSHASAEARVWGKAVNDSTQVLSLNRIGANAYSPEDVAAATSDLINARVKNAEMAGAQPGDEVWNQAVSGAKADALKAQVQAIAVNDPGLAWRMLEQPGNKGILGAQWDELALRVKGRAEQQVGMVAAAEELGRAPTARPQSADTIENIGARILAPEGTGPDRSGPGGAPASTAHSGFLKGTWDHIREGNPDSGLPASPAEASPEQLSRAAELYAKENSEVLRRADLPSNPTNLRLAHFLGPVGAVSVLKASPETPVASVLSAEAVAANPQALGGKTVSEVVAEAAAQMGETVAVPGESTAMQSARMSRASALERINARTDLNPNEKAAARAAIKTHFETVAAMEAEEKRARDEKRSAFTSTFEIQLNRGQKTYNDIEAAWQQGLIGNEKRTDFTLLLDKKRAESDKVMAQIGRVQMAVEGQAILDPRTEADRKAVDSHYAMTAAAWKALPPDDIAAQAVQYAVNVGITPTPLKQMVRGSLRGTDPNKAIQAANILKQMRNANPQLLNDFNDEDLTIGNLIGTYTEYGVKPDEAFTLAQDALKVTQTVRETRKAGFNMALGTDAKARDTKIKSWLEDKLDSSWWWNTDPTIDPIMQAEFERLSRLEFERTGNIDASMQFAFDKTNKVWGRTEVGGNLRYMKYTPEKMFGVAPTTPGYDSEWQNEQLIDSVRALAPSIKQFQEFRAEREKERESALARMATDAFTPGLDVGAPTTGLTGPQEEFEKEVYRQWVDSLEGGLYLTVDPTKTGKDGRPRYNVSFMTDAGLVAITNERGVPASWYPDWKTSNTYRKIQEDQAAAVEDVRRRRLGIIESQKAFGGLHSTKVSP